MFPLQRGAATWLFLVLAIVGAGHRLSQAAENNQRVVCYYTNWSVYRPGTAKFNPQNINPYLCTHLIYSFGGFTKENTLKPYDKYQDIEQGGFAKFTGLKTYNKNLKTMLAIGGWNEGSSRFSPLVADPERRAQFVRNSIKFLRQNHFDGLDLDWEYPAFRDGSKPKDRENYAQLVQELREEFDRESSKTGRPRLILTMAVPAGTEYIEKGYDVQKLNKYLDWFNLLTYDYHSAYEPAVNHHSPLYPLEEPSEYNFDSDLNIDHSIKFYLNAGADREKLVLGIPTYGRSYTLYNPDATEIGSPADGPGEQGDATREKGYLAYYEICTAVKDDPEWTVVQPNANAMGPYAFKGNQWVGYDDEEIARKKAKYVAENGLGGIMFWSIDNDDFRGTCHGKPYPIIEAAKETLLASTDLGANDIISSSRPRKPSRSRSRTRTNNSSTNQNRLSTENNNEIKSSFKSSQSRKNTRPTARPTTTTTSTTTEGSLYIGGRTTTPQPPTTPDPGADFKCTDEGFFPHPRDCKKYFWCLDAPALGLVAHQFTCPSGLVFNKLADSCDYARNVICSKQTTTTTTSTTSTSTTTTTTTPSPRPRVTASTSRNNFFNRAITSTTTTEPSIEAEYSDEEENEETQPEEDPKVIKELIALIKKVGGIEELERQLQAQEDGTVVLKDGQTDQISTTPSTISKSLYERVLSRAGNGLQKFRPALTFTQTDKSGSTENKYSSVVRNGYSNSRLGPQNEGIEQLPEFEGVFKERPKYVTLNRPKINKSSLEEDDEEERYDEEDGYAEEENQPSTRVSLRPTNSPKYVSIQRQRPTTTAGEDDVEEDEEEESAPAPQQQYSSVNRNRFRQTTTTEEPVEEVERTPNRYNTIDRRRTTAQSNRLQEGDKDDVGTDSSLYVPSTDYQSIYTTSSTTDAPEQLITFTTRQYASVERSSTPEAPQTGPSATDLPQTILPITTTTTSPPSKNAGSFAQLLNTDLLQTEPPSKEGPIETFSGLGLSKTAAADFDGGATTDDSVTQVDNSKNDQTYEVTTILNLGESDNGISVSALDSSVFSSNVGSSVGDSVNPSSQVREDLTTLRSNEVPITTTGVPSTTAIVSEPKLTSTNEEQSNLVYKFPSRTRKTTTTASPQEVVTNSQDPELTPTQAAPRPFGGAVRRTRPTRRPVTTASTTTLAPEDSTTLRSVKVSFANNGQRFDVSSARRRIGVASSPAVSNPSSNEVTDAREFVDSEPSLRPTRPRGFRGRVRFGSSTEANVVLNEAPAVVEQPRRPASDTFARNRFSLNRASSRVPEATTTTTTVAATSSSTAKTTTPEQPVEQSTARASLRRLNFNLYNGRGSTDQTSSTTPEPEIETESPVANLDLKSHSNINEELFKTQERILLTLGTALQYGFSNRNELNARRIQESQAQLTKGTVEDSPITNIVRDRPIIKSRTQSEDTIDNKLAEDVNEMATESVTSERTVSNFESTASETERSSDYTTVYNVNAAEVETTTPGQRKFFGAIRGRQPTTTETNETTLKVVLSEVNTNKTFIPGRSRPTRPSRFRASTASSAETLNEASTLRSKFASRKTTIAPSSNAIVNEDAEKTSRRPSPFVRRRLTLSTTSASPVVSVADSNDVTEKPSGISTTVTRRRLGRRRPEALVSTSEAPAVVEAKPRERNTLVNRRQRLQFGRTTTTSSTTEQPTTLLRAATTTAEPFTADVTYPDSAVGNSDFTTIISEVSNEIESTFLTNEVLSSDNLLRQEIPESRDENNSEETTELLSTAITPEPSTESPKVTPTRRNAKPANGQQRLNDSQQIESEVIPSRSPARFGATRKKFGASTTTTTESPEVSTVKKFIPSRKNRPSFSVARARASSTTEEPFEQDQEQPSSTTARSFAPSRRRNQLNFAARASTTSASVNADENGESSSSRPQTVTRRRPGFAVNRTPRPQSFEDSFDKGSANVKSTTERKVNRNSVLLPRRPNLFARTTTTTTEAYTETETDEKTTLEEETSAERYGPSTRGYSEIRRPSSSEERDGVTGRYSGEIGDDENEIQRQGKRLFGSLGSGNNNLEEEGEQSKGRTSGEVVSTVRRPGPRIVGSGGRGSAPGSNTRFIFKNNQPIEGSSTTVRAVTTRTRRPFGNIGGYKPSNATSANAPAAAGSATTARPRFNLTTRGRPVFGKQRSTTAPVASGDVEEKSTQQRVNETQQGTGPSRRYQPRKTTRKPNLTTISLPVGGGSRTRTNLSSLFNSRNAAAAQTTTEQTADTSIPETTLPSVESQTPVILSVLPIGQKPSTPPTLDTENEIENTTSYEDTINTVRTTTEYYTASDETLYTTLNTADTIYTINDNIDIDDVNVLQDRSRTSTTTVRPTTLYHVFSIDKESESMPSSTEIYRTEEQEIELPSTNKTDKLVEIHRVVEIYTKNTSNPDEIPTMQKLGEINRKIIIRLVEPKNKTDVEDKEKKSRTLVFADNIFNVETSTIPLEGLFDEKNGRTEFQTTELNMEDDVTTVAPRVEIERISSSDFGSTERDHEELITITPLIAETERYTQVRPNFRPPGLRRPSSAASTATTTQQPAVTTTARGKTTRRSELDPQLGTATTPSSYDDANEGDASDDQKTTTPSSLLSRRRRPTTSYLSKLNQQRQRPAAAVLGQGNNSEESTLSSSQPTDGAAAADRPTSSKTKSKLAASANSRRRFGPTRTGSSQDGANAATKSPDLESTTRVNSLFKRRPGQTLPGRTPAPPPGVINPSFTSSTRLYNKNRLQKVTEAPTQAVEDQQPPAPEDSDVDQEIEPSIRQQSKLVNAKNSNSNSNENSRYNQIGEGVREREPHLDVALLDAITTISRAPLPQSTTSRNFVFSAPQDQRSTPRSQALRAQGELPGHMQRATTHKYNITHEYTLSSSYQEPYSTTRRSQKIMQRPRIATQTQFYYQQTTPNYFYSSHPPGSARKHKKQDTYEKSTYNSAAATSGSRSNSNNGKHRKKEDYIAGRAYRPATDYDYYDDGEQRVIGKTSSQVKVIMHGPGIIECLDQGNFPHPLSCKKFISCAKMEIGGVVGWEYTCPKGLSYDPVGGICNWSAGLGCKD
ncbi:mucin-5AC-like isoform X2 [Uranotaenia lowii]|uniref:mucin-5AC-like isoform X2 n=1 Tax=Uranotaenia lowii TaxID=190385 RepID=UPI0024784561|nr:mucin-5AC-like isoform X2 [Uranotaenia lowii]